MNEVSSDTLDSAVFEALRAMPTGPETCLIQVGAGDGRTGDFLNPHLTHQTWRAWLLEPHPASFRELCVTYQNQPHITCLQLGIADIDGNQDLYAVRDTDGLPWWAGQLPSLRRDVVLSHESLIPDLARKLETISVPCQTWSSFLTTHSMPGTDIVAVDAEGMDAVIVRQILSSSARVQVLLFEHKHLSLFDRQALFQQLKPRFLVIRGPWDTLCVVKGHAAEIVLMNQGLLG